MSSPRDIPDALLQRYLAEALSSREAKAIANALAQDENLRARLDVLREEQSAYLAAHSSTDFSQRVREELQAPELARVKPTRSWQAFLPFGVMATGFAAVALVVSVGLDSEPAVRDIAEDGRSMLGQAIQEPVPAPATPPPVELKKDTDEAPRFSAKTLNKALDPVVRDLPARAKAIPRRKRLGAPSGQSVGKIATREVRTKTKKSAQSMRQDVGFNDAAKNVAVESVGGTASRMHRSRSSSGGGPIDRAPAPQADAALPAASALEESESPPASSRFKWTKENAWLRPARSGLLSCIGSLDSGVRVLNILIDRESTSSQVVVKEEPKADDELRRCVVRMVVPRVTTDTPPRTSLEIVHEEHGRPH